MKKYDFETVVDRSHTFSLKWDVKDGVLPMWVADMDFKAAPEIQAALLARTQEGLYGYSILPPEWEEAYRDFYRERHQLEIPKGSLLFSSGVIPTLSSSVRAFSKPGDRVVVLPPVYHIFYHSITNNGRMPLEVPLLSKGGQYEIDWEGLERAYREEHPALILFCNPENPVGRLWTREELCRLGALSRAYGVLVVSDEIHGEIVRPGLSYVPYLKASEENAHLSVSAVSPTKCFNLAGIQTSAAVVPDEKIRLRLERQLNADEVEEPNFFAVVAAIAAYREGREWLDEMREVVFRNRKMVEDFVEERALPLKVLKGDATYLLWIDALELTDDVEGFNAYLEAKEGLKLSYGGVFGPGGEKFLRMNVACPEKLLREGLARLEEGARTFPGRRH